MRFFGDFLWQKKKKKKKSWKKDSNRVQWLMQNQCSEYIGIYIIDGKIREVTDNIYKIITQIVNLDGYSCWLRMEQFTRFNGTDKWSGKRPPLGFDGVNNNKLKKKYQQKFWNKLIASPQWLIDEMGCVGRECTNINLCFGLQLRY
jgi:hypothetical protein